MKKISRALIFANEEKPIARKVKREVKEFLLKHRIKIASPPQLVITVGGDGTTLFNKRHYGIPFFAIGSKTSFLCQANFSNWKEKLGKTIKKMKKEKRLLLSCRLNGKKLPLVLNEIGIRNPEPRVLSLHLSIGRKHFAFRADGILFSTPTGSPAYCYSCGGKEIKKTEMKKYQAVAIAPFRRIFSPTLVPSNKTCKLRISGREKAQVFIDGQPFGEITEKSTLTVKASKIPFLFAK